ncbi:DUF6263 family protein [bacterium]|nr:DUF6263 family protein [bacterium]
MSRKSSWNFPFLFCLLLVSTAVSSAFAADKLDLKLDLQTGQTYKLRTVSENSMKTNMNGQDINTSQKMTMDMLSEVTDKSSTGDQTVKTTFERVKFVMEGPRGGVSFDSAEPGADDSNPMVAAFTALVGKSYSLTLSQQGQVLKTTGMDSLIGAMLDKTPSGNEQMRQAMRAQFEKMLGGEGGPGFAGKMFSFIPKKPVAVGESWSLTDSVNAIIVMKVEQTWTLDSLVGGVAVIKATSRMSSDSTAPFTEMGPMKMKMNLNGEMSGHLRVDTKSGWMLGGTMDQRMSGTQIIVGGPAGDKEMRMPLEMEVKTTFGPY